jgi:hypothetical protein
VIGAEAGYRFSRFAGCGEAGNCMLAGLHLAAGLLGEENGKARLFDFGQQTIGELDGGEQGVGDGTLDAASRQGLDDFIEGGKDGGLVHERREDERLRFRGFFFGWPGRALRVVVAAEFRAVDGECAASLAVVEGLRASRCHGFSLVNSGQ